jgi:hypothetical protein
LNIVKWLYLAIFGYLFYSVLKVKYKSSKKNEIQYDENSVRIPEHLCTILNSCNTNSIFKGKKANYQNYIKNSVEKVTYKTIKWDDIKSWEYKIVTHINFNHTICLYITTTNETFYVTDVPHLTKMKRHFKKYSKDKQIINFSNKMELWGIFFSSVIVTIFTYVLLFRK